MPLPRSVDLRSDTVSLPSQDMLATIRSAELGDDIMREDRTVLRLERMAAEILGMEAAVLLTSGTMANQVAVMVLTQRGDEVVVGAESHIYNMEAGGLSALSQVQVRAVPARCGVPQAADIEAALFPRDADRVQSPETGLICLENTYNLNAGRVMGPEGMASVADVAARHRLPVFLDGARIFNAAAALDVAPADLCRHVDAVQFNLTKALGAPIGSLLAGSDEFVAQARKVKQRLGGGMRQAGIIAAPGLYALEHLRDRIPQDHARARALAVGLSSIEGLEVAVEEVETNIVPVQVSHPGWSVGDLLTALAAEGIKAKPIGAQRLRMVTHVNIDDADIAHVLETTTRLLSR